MAALSTEGCEEAQPSSIDLFSLTPTMPCVERVYYDEQRSTSQVSGNLPIEFMIAAQNSLDIQQEKFVLKSISLSLANWLTRIPKFLIRAPINVPPAGE